MASSRGQLLVSNLGVLNKYLVIAFASALLGGCISAPPRDSAAAGRLPGSQPAAPSESTPAPASTERAQGTAPERTGASTLLLEQGRAQHEAGAYADATSTIERALRIDPNNPELWLELGEIKWDEGNREQAELMARKALSLAAGDRAVESRAMRLIR